MAGVLRRLVTEVVLKSTKAVKDLKAYDALWKTVAKSVDASASAIERSADRAAAAMSRISAGAANVRASVPRGGGGSGRGSGGGASRKDPLDAAIGSANKTAARQAGLAAGAQTINEATSALGRLATASDKAKAKVADLSAQVERNRREMTALREQTVKTGDADGTLAARMQGLAVATAKASGELREARAELRKVDGGLIDAVKGAANLEARFGALRVAAGNLLSAGVSRLAGGFTDALAGSAKSAMDFEKALVDVAKVAQEADLKGDLLDPRVKQGIKDVAKDLGVMPTEVAELTAQITAAFSGKTDIVALASDVTKIGVAWDITGKQAGEYFKQTSAGLQINADETKALFGSINELGNKLGVKSSEIAEAMTRSAGVLKGANISGETGAALNATLIKAGASAEVAATGVRTFIARLGAGEAATDKQIAAFQALGLSAKDVAKNLASGDAAKAEAQIKEVVAALVKMGETAPDKRMATLIQLFGSESIGSIGAAASAVDTLATSFGIAGDKAAALESVQKEYLRVSDTTAARVEKLKANIGVLAIELGEALLPHIDKVVNFLTSPEGQEWGANAVAKAVEVVTSLASALGTVGSALSSLIDLFGGTGVAVAGLGVAIAGLAGPWGIAAAAATAALTAMSLGIGKLLDQIPQVSNAVNALGAEIAKKATQEMIRKTEADDDADIARSAPLHGGGVGYAYEAQAAAPSSSSAAPEASVEDRTAEFQSLLARRKNLKPSERARLKRLSRELDISLPRSSGGGGSGVNLSGYSDTEKDELFKELSARKASGGTLKPSEAALLRALSKNLDRAVPGKMSKMDQQLAALSPDLAGVLRGADGSASKDPLSLGVLKAAGAANGLGGIGGGSGGVGPGPNITTNNYFTTITVQQSIDARSTGSVPENIRTAAYDAGTQVGNVVFTGIERAKALKQGGGRMA